MNELLERVSIKNPVDDQSIKNLNKFKDPTMRIFKNLLCMETIVWTYLCETNKEIIYYFSSKDYKSTTYLKYLKNEKETHTYTKV